MTTEKRNTPLPKIDSRKQACEKYKISERTFRAVNRMANDRKDLFEQVVAGTLDPTEALKRKGKNAEIDRAKLAMALNAQPVVLADATLENNIHCCDAVEGLKRVPDGAASLVLFSPPYHDVPIEYDPPLPKQNYAEYLQELGKVLTESFRVCRRGGRLAIVLDTVRNREGDRHFMLPVVADVTRLAIDCGWGFLNEPRARSAAPRPTSARWASVRLRASAATTRRFCCSSRKRTSWMAIPHCAT